MSQALSPPRVRLASLVLIAGLAGTSLACGSGSGSPADGGSPSLGGQCIATGVSCVDDAGINEYGSCCSGLCPGHVCNSANVDFSSSCAPVPCGGNPVGIWHIVGGCGQSTCSEDGGTGSVLGTVVIAMGGPNQFTINNATVGVETLSCGRNDSDNSSGGIGGGAAEVDGGVAGLPYCVQGATLWLFLDNPYVPALTALKLTH
jgi:hypothetical protein